MRLQNKTLSLLLLLALNSCGDDSTISVSQQYNESCDNQRQCMAGLYCEDGTCRMVCTDNNDCNHMQTCQDGRCVNNFGNSCNSGWKGANCDECATGYYGANCAICPNCGEHGTCKDTLQGDGTCKCNDGWIGEYCEEKQQCPDGFTGENCDQCRDGFFGLKCEPCTCKHGRCNDTLSGNGFCRDETCEEKFTGINCNQCKEPSIFTGENCDQCTNTNYSGENCDQCADGHYGETCTKICDCPAGLICRDGLDGDGACLIRDDQDNTYRTVAINNNIWMAENSRYDQDVMCYTNPDVEDYKTAYGCLYTWDDAVKVCPAGWRLPTKSEYDSLVEYVNSNKKSANAFLALITKSNDWENYAELGGDDYGFSMVPSGGYGPNEETMYANFGIGGYIWSLTESENNTDRAYYLDFTGGQVKTYSHVKTDALSVRCIKAYCQHGVLEDSDSGRCEIDSCSDNFVGDYCDRCKIGAIGDDCNHCRAGFYGKKCEAYDSVTDEEGNIYKTITINDKKWMAENLRNSQVEHSYPNGEQAKVEGYGLLYTREAALKACPNGWRLPTSEELEAILKNNCTEKSNKYDSSCVRASSWKNGLDTFGFAALPAGVKFYGGSTAAEFGARGLFWSATLNESGYAMYLDVTSDLTFINGSVLGNAFSVRCVR